MLIPSNQQTEFADNALLRTDGQPVNWKISNDLVTYPAALSAMKARVEKIVLGQASEQIWLLEHPPLYTSGTSARKQDLLTPDRFPVFEAGRGGQFTYHGPGQRVVYVMLDLRQRQRDVRRFVQNLEAWIIDSFAALNIEAFRVPGRVGVWVNRQDNRQDKGPMRQDKIAAIGVRLSRWVSFHGFSINMSPDLEHYQGIVPCGIVDQGVTSFSDLGFNTSLSELDQVLLQKFHRYFGETEPVHV